MSLPLVPVDSLSGPFREKVDGVVALGGDTSFFQFAANAPDLVSFYWGDFYQGAFFAGRVPRRLKQLVRLRLAGHSGCGFCQVGDAESARLDGVTQAEIDAVLRLDVNGFDATEMAVLRLADHIAATTPPMPVGDDLMASLTAALDPEQLVELFMVAAVLNGMGRMLVATGFIPATCEVPSAVEPSPRG